MNNIVALYTTLNGRIGRQTWWIYSIVLGLVVGVVGWLAQNALGIHAVAIDTTQSPDAIIAAANAVVQKAAWVSVVLLIISAFPAIALGVKRRHDKGNNGLDVIIFFALELIYNLAQGLGLTFSAVGGILGLVVLIYAVYLLVVLGFLKGTAGPNSYGPNPLG